MRRIFTRQQLYDMVWERPASKVAPELGISDVALRKQCKRHDVPLPTNVYWGRKHSGRPVARAPLPPLAEGVLDKIVIDGGGPPPAPAVQEAVATAAKAETLEVPATLHPLVSETMSLAKKASVGERGVVSHLGPQAFGMRVPPEMLDRVASLLNVIVRNALARGHSFAPGKEMLEIVVDGESIPFMFIQPMRQTRHVETEEERKRVERWDARNRGNTRWDNWENRPTIPRYDFAPSGGLILEIERWSRFPGAQHRFMDTRTTKLEERVGDILAAFSAWSVGLKIARAEAEERARQHRLAEERRLEAQREARLEEQRVAYLERKLAQHGESERLRSFLENVGDEGTPGTDHFLHWARQRLERLSQALAGQTIATEVSRIEAFNALTSATTSKAGSSAPDEPDDPPSLGGQPQP